MSGTLNCDKQQKARLASNKASTGPEIDQLSPGHPNPPSKLTTCKGGEHHSYTTPHQNSYTSLGESVLL
jgi:hypothetical protein